MLSLTKADILSHYFFIVYLLLNKKNDKFGVLKKYEYA